MSALKKNLYKIYVKKYKGHHDFWNIFWEPAISEFTSAQTELVRRGAEMPTWPVWFLWAKPPASDLPGNDVVHAEQRLFNN